MAQSTLWYLRWEALNNAAVGPGFRKLDIGWNGGHIWMIVRSVIEKMEDIAEAEQHGSLIWAVDEGFHSDIVKSFIYGTQDL